MSKRKIWALVSLIVLSNMLSGCVAATVVGAVVGTTAAVVTTAVTLPIKATGAVVDMVTDDDDCDD